MKKTVNAFDYAGKICQSMKKGILLMILTMRSTPILQILQIVQMIMLREK